LFLQLGGLIGEAAAAVDQPVPGPGQVLVKVAGTTFNPIDAGIRAGYLQQIMPVELPLIPGIDLAGSVVDTGEQSACRSAATPSS
jgi:NADPH:quinone reductase-like Zn-dependent oxidoreductase